MTLLSSTQWTTGVAALIPCGLHHLLVMSGALPSAALFQAGYVSGCNLWRALTAGSELMPSVTAPQSLRGWAQQVVREAEGLGEHRRGFLGVSMEEEARQARG